MNNPWAQRRRLATIPAALLALLVLCPLAFAAQWFDGDTICYENPYGKVCQNPHTLTDFTNFVEVNATSYFNVSQDLDFAFGFESGGAVPKKAWYWKQNAAHQVPTYGNVSRSLQCSGPFNYSLDPNRAWCYNSTENLTLVWERGFVNAWLANATIEWFEWAVTGSQTAYWPDWVELTQFSTAYYAGKKWFVLTASFAPNETKRLRAKIDVKPWTRGKYDVAIKRSSDSWIDAFSSGHVAVLDPWWDGNWASRKQLTLNESAGVDRFMEPLTLNVTGLTLATDNCSQELRVTAGYSTETAIEFTVLNASGQGFAAGTQYCLIQFLVNMSASANASYVARNATNYWVYFDNGAATDPAYGEIKGWTFHFSGDKDPLDDGWVPVGGAPHYCDWNASSVNSENYVWAGNDSSSAPEHICVVGKAGQTATSYTAEARMRTIAADDVWNGFGPIFGTNLQGVGLNATYGVVAPAGVAPPAHANAWDDVANDFHVYRILSNETYYEVWRDGVFLLSGSNNSATGSDFKMLLGENYYSDSYTNQKFEIDYFVALNASAGANVFFAPLVASLGAQEDQTFYGFNVTSTTYSSPVYETNESLFNVTIEYNSSFISSLQLVNLVYNGSEYNTTQTDNGSTAYFNRTHAASFLSGSNVNNTGLPFYWSIHGNYSNGTDFIVNTSSYTQFVWFAWFWNAWTVSPTALLWGQQAIATMNTTRMLGTATLSAQIDWSATNYSLTADGFNFTRVNTAPGYSTTFGVVGWLNVSFDGSSRLNMTTNVSVTVTAASIIACNATANQTILNFSARNEESNVSVNFTMDATFWLWDASRTVNATYSSNWTNVAYVELCIYPNWASGQVDSFQQYYFNGYYPRNYFLDHASVSNATTQNVSLILANNTLTKNTLFTLKDANGLLLGGRTIVVQRYYASTNSFETIAMMRTDGSGAGLTYLTANDVFYIYSIVLDGNVIEIITPSAPISCSPVLSQCTKELQLSTVLIGEYYQTAGQIAGNCSWSPSTNLTVCIVSDGSGLSRSWRLTVTKLGLAANTVACVATLNSSAGVLTCPVTDDGEYSASLVALGSFSVVESFTFVKGALTSLFGLDFVFLSLLVILSIGFAAIASPAAGVFFLSIGVAFAKLLGLLVISVGATIMVVALGILIAWKLRK